MFLKTEDKTLIGILVLFFSLMFFLVPKGGFEWDIFCWGWWTHEVINPGIGQIYVGGKSNYLPVTLYLLKIYYWIIGDVSLIESKIHYFKVIILIFDLFTVYLVSKLCFKNGISIYKSLFILLNIAFLYNTVLWGQVDTLYTFMVFCSLLFAIENKVLFSSIFFFFAISTKLQAIIFLPLIGLILLPEIIKKPQYLFYIFISFFVIESLIFMPFIINGQFDAAINNITNSVDFFPKVSMNAFNFWYLIIPGNLNEVSDQIKFGPFSYKLWGSILFILSSFIVLIPLILTTISRFKKNRLFEKSELHILFLTFALISVIFFYFNTQMHERYLHPAILFTGVYFIFTNNYFLYIIISIAHFLNLEKVLRFIKFNNYETFLFKIEFICILHLVFIIYGLYLLYFKYYQIKKEKFIIE